MKKYTYPISYKVGSTLMILISISILYLFRNNHQPGKILFVILFVFAGLYFLVELYKSFTIITMTSTSIIVKSLFRSEKEINFREIYSIADLNAESKITLINSDGEILLAIFKNIQNYIELREQLITKQNKLAKEHISDVFKTSNTMIILLIGSLVFLIVPMFILFIRNEYLLGVVSIACTSYLLYSRRNIITTVHLTDSSIVLKYLYKTSIINMSDVKSIYQETQTKSNDLIMTYTVIETKIGEKILLAKFKPNDELLFQSCKYYYENKKHAT